MRAFVVEGLCRIVLLTARASGGPCGPIRCVSRDLSTVRAQDDNPGIDGMLPPPVDW